jgi:non-canonical purine NTP pyrophosphatase (RdgB/HAM1 family)
MEVGIAITVVSVVIAAVIGGWQIHLARKQVRLAEDSSPVRPPANPQSSLSLQQTSRKSPASRKLPRLKGSAIVFVSKNRQKLEEFRQILGVPDLASSNIDVPDLSDMNLETVVRRKVEIARGMLPAGTIFFVEHTALMIDGWNGMPGGLTKQFMDVVGSAGICKMMQGFKGSERIARAKTVIGFCVNEKVQLFEGTVIGTMADCPRTEDAFGWDDIFIPHGEKLTYAELGQLKKNSISMRRRAAESFAEYLRSHYQLV